MGHGVHEDDRRSFFQPFLLLVFFNFLDIWLTGMILTLPHTKEANPLMAAMFRDGVLWAAALKTALVLLVGLISWLFWSQAKVRRLLFIAVALMFALVLYQIRGVASHLDYLYTLYGL